MSIARTLLQLVVTAAVGASGTAPAVAQSAGGWPVTVGQAAAPSVATFPASLTAPSPPLAAFPEAAYRTVGSVDAEGERLTDVLLSIAAQSGLDLTADGLDGRTVSVHLPQGSAADALVHIADQEALVVSRFGDALLVEPRLTSASVAAEPVGLPRATGVPPPVDRPPSPLPYPAPATLPLGFSGVSVQPPAAGQSAARVTVAVEDVPLADVLRDIARQASLSLVLPAAGSSYGGAPADARVTARWADLPLDEALQVLLTGSALTYRRNGFTLIVGDRTLPALQTTRLLRLRHIPAAGLLERLPESIRREAAVQLIQEQNGVIVTGPADVVAAASAVVDSLDVSPDQILLEVLVVEFETSGLRQIGVSFLGGLLPGDPSAPALSEPGRPAYVFGGGNDQRGGFDVVGDATAAERVLNFWSDVLGIRSIGRLPTDFYFRLQALERAGQAEVRSRPHIATLNGNTASITVGTAQYYILKSAYGYGQAGPFGSAAEAERFEYVRADVQLEITPWVGSNPSGEREVTALIRPTFATPVGAFDPRVPPTINSWSVDTSVRLRDGETFMIGGLVQERNSRAENRVPLLGRIPLLGRLFRNSERSSHKSELVIFITPHVLSTGPQTATSSPEGLGAHPHLAPHTARELRRGRVEGAD